MQRDQNNDRWTSRRVSEPVSLFGIEIISRLRKKRLKDGWKGRKKPIMLLDDIKTNETYEMIKRRALDRENWRRNWMPALEQNTK